MAWWMGTLYIICVHIIVYFCDRACECLYRCVLFEYTSSYRFLQIARVCNTKIHSTYTCSHTPHRHHTIIQLCKSYTHLTHAHIYIIIQAHIVSDDLMHMYIYVYIALDIQKRVGRGSSHSISSLLIIMQCGLCAWFGLSD